MIYIIYKEMIVKPEMREKFMLHLKTIIDTIKKEELNLSTDVWWKNDTTLILVERWSTEQAYNSYVRSPEGKQAREKLEFYIDYVIRVERSQSLF